MATLRKRGSKWHVQIRRSGQASATRSFTHKANAEAWSRKLERDLDRGEITSQFNTLTTMTVGDLLNRYAVENTTKKRGADIERYRINHFLDCQIAAKHLSNVCRQDVIKYKDERLLQVHPGTVHRELKILRHCFEVATCSLAEFVHADGTKILDTGPHPDWAWQMHPEVLEALKKLNMD